MLKQLNLFGQGSASSAVITSVAISSELIACGLSRGNEWQLLVWIAERAVEISVDCKISSLAIDQESTCVFYASRSGAWILEEPGGPAEAVLNIYKDFRDAPDSECFDRSSLLIAVAEASSILILRRNGEEAYARLDGHRARVTALAFSYCETHPWLLVSASEESSFKIWNLKDRLCIYESAVLFPSSPIMALAVDGYRMAFASADSRLWLWEMSPSQHTCHDLYRAELSTTNEESTLTLGFGSEKKNEIEKILFAVTTQQIVALNINTQEVIPVLQSDIKAHRAALHNDSLVLAAAFEAKLYTGTLSIPNDEIDTGLTFFTTGEIPKDSPLTKVPPRQKIDPKKKPLSSYDTRAKSSTDAPILFHAKIRSSGYGNKQNDRNKRSSVAQKTKRMTQSRRRVPTSEYPIHCGLLDMHQSQHDWGEKQQAIRALTMSSDARLAAIAVNDGPALVQRLPVARKRDQITVVGRRERQRVALAFSYDSNWLLTTATDSTVEIWPLTQYESCLDDPVATITPTFLTEEKRKNSFRGGAARFFSLDRFILSAEANRVNMYHFVPPGDQKLAHGFEISGQHVTALAALNSVLSPLILAASSNRDIVALDARTGKESHTFKDAHAKPVHCVATPEPSAATSVLPQSHFDVFATAATDGVITVWDLRMARCAKRMSAHVNRREHISIAFSPCLRYLAAGSEDNCAFIYDLRSARPAARLKGHSDVVSCVAWNPLFPQFVSASYDGHLRFYTSASENESSPTSTIRGATTFSPRI